MRVDAVYVWCEEGCRRIICKDDGLWKIFSVSWKFFPRGLYVLFFQYDEKFSSQLKIFSPDQTLFSVSWKFFQWIKHLFQWIPELFQ